FTVLETCNLGSLEPGRLALAVADVYLAGQLGPRAERRDSTTERRAAASGEGLPVPPGGSNSTSLAGLVGDYYSSELDVTYHVALRDDDLVLSARHKPAEPLVPTGPDSFRGGPAASTWTSSGTSPRVPPPRSWSMAGAAAGFG